MSPTPRQIIDAIRQEFFERIERKTGWGKEELKKEFEQAIADALMRFIGD